MEVAGHFIPEVDAAAKYVIGRKSTMPRV